MKRRDGFRIADTDTGLYHDPKVLALARRQRDHLRTAAAMLLWNAARLASWDSGQRFTLAETAPAWWPDDPAEYLADLQAVDLLDGEGRIPVEAWEDEYGPARDRRRTAEYKGAIGGLMRSLGLSYEDAAAELRRRATEASPKGPLGDPQGIANPSVRPSVRPAVPPAGTDEADDASRAPAPARDDDPGGSPPAAATGVDQRTTNDPDGRRRLAKAIRDAKDPELRAHHRRRFDQQYGDRYPRAAS